MKENSLFASCACPFIITDLNVLCAQEKLTTRLYKVLRSSIPAVRYIPGKSREVSFDCSINCCFRNRGSSDPKLMNLRIISLFINDILLMFNPRNARLIFRNGDRWRIKINSRNSSEDPRIRLPGYVPLASASCDQFNGSG